MLKQTTKTIADGLLKEDVHVDMGFGTLAMHPAGSVGLVRQIPGAYVMPASPDVTADAWNVGGTNTELVDNLSFGNLSSAVKSPPTSITLDNGVFDGGSVAATVETPELLAGARDLAAVSGFAGGGTPGSALLPFRDEFEESASTLGRVVHASPDAPSVDVGLWDAGKNSAAISDYSDLTFGEAFPDSGLPIDAMPLNHGAAATGTTHPAATLDHSLLSIEKARKVAVGSLGGTGEAFKLVFVDATNSPGRRRK